MNPEECKHKNMQPIATPFDPPTLTLYVVHGAEKLPTWSHSSYAYCVDCKHMFEPIFGIGSRMPAGYIQLPSEFIERFMKEIEQIEEEFGYTTQW